MLRKLPFQLSEFLFVSIQNGMEPPAFFRVALKKIHAVILAAGALLFGLSLLSLLFFREVELNRRLSQKVLELETDNQLIQLQKSRVAFGPAPSTNAPTPSAPAAAIAAVPVPVPVPEKIETPTAETRAVTMDTSRGVTARLSDLSTECIDDSCEVKVSLVPSQQGIAEGRLLLVLELEVPRIGGGAAQGRKKFMIYPGYASVEQLDSTKVVELEKKPFRFSKGLQSGVTFTMGKLLDPLAINLYLFDKENNIVLHERRPIESEESDGP